MMEKKDFILLLDKYVSGHLTPAEHNNFLQLVASGNYNEIIQQHIGNNLLNAELHGAGLPPHRSAHILHKILFSEQQNNILVPVKSARARWVKWCVAAAVLCFAMLAVYRYTREAQPVGLATESFISGFKKILNTSIQPEKNVMEDGSVITLQPGSIIHYPDHFLKDKREIFLEGGAFFNVSKDASRPFYVYNKNIVTRVLGTTFNVHLNAISKEVEVAVSSGRVEVYENSHAAKAVKNKNTGGVILLPNQKVIYHEESRQFTASLVDVPVPVVKENIALKNVASPIFENSSLKLVLEGLQNTYGIEIVVESENLYKCLFTGDLSRQGLYSSLDIICQSVMATYEIKGTKILITGKGC